MRNLEIAPGSDENKDGGKEFDENEHFNEMLDDGDLGEYE